MASLTTEAAPGRQISTTRLTMRIVGTTIGLLLGAYFITSVATNENLAWDVVARYLFSTEILIGLGVTIQLTLLSGVLALIVGVALVALARWGKIGEIFVGGYVWLFRSIPLLVQLLFWFNLGLVMPRIMIGVPDGPYLLNISTNDLITGFMASLLGLALHESAYFAEIIRGGLLAVPQGQYRAAAALGMTQLSAYRYVIGPQALRVAVPALTNQMVGLLKATSMVAVIGGGELLTRAQWIYAQNFQVVPLLIVVTIWYVVLVGIATLIQKFIEKRMTVTEREAEPLADEARAAQERGAQA